MHTFVFRSRKLIVEADEADLVRDVGLDLDKAQTKLKAIRRRLKGVQEQAAAEIQLLTKAEARLAAAIEVALSPKPDPAVLSARELIDAYAQIAPEHRSHVTRGWRPRPGG